ncbi:unnamed protein product, partial [Amoebophrya sp. A25]
GGSDESIGASDKKAKAFDTNEQLRLQLYANERWFQIMKTKDSTNTSLEQQLQVQDHGNQTKNSWFFLDTASDLCLNYYAYASTGGARAEFADVATMLREVMAP